MKSIDLSKSHKIRSIEEIVALRAMRRSVYIEFLRRPFPAAVILNQQASVLLKWIDEGKIYEYTKAGDKPFFSITK